MKRVILSRRARPSTMVLIALCFLVTMIPTPALSETSIGNGNLFTCSGTSVLSVRSGAEVLAKRAIARYRRIIRKKKNLIAELSKGSKRRARAVAAKKVARQGLRDARQCKNGELDGANSFLGNWNLILENGLTPVENGYNSLTLVLNPTGFISDFDSNALDCHWEGSYSTTSNPDNITILTTVGTGGVPCTQAINQMRSASMMISEDGNTLTLDYRPAGTLQVFERV